MLHHHPITSYFLSYIKPTKYIHLQKEVINILHNFYSLLHTANDFIHYDSYHITPFTRSYDLQEHKYLPAPVIATIYHDLTFQHIYKFHIENRSFSLTFITSENKVNSDYFKLAYMWLHIAVSQSKSSCSEVLHTRIYMTNEEKKLDNDAEILDSIHINSAYTYGGCHNKNEIVIYRKEEWFKVFIHETFHAFAFDQQLLNPSLYKKQIHDIFPIPNKEPILFNETYCETWAIIMNSAFHAYMSSNNSVKDFVKTFKYIYSHECYFSYMQMSKILGSMGITYKNLYSHDKNSIAKRTTYRENTNVFAYYVLKSIIMQDINSFLILCSKHHNLFQCDGFMTNDYVALLYKNYKSLSFTHCLIKNEKNLRMSMFDFV